MECRIVKARSKLCHGMSFCYGDVQSYVMECRIVKVMVKVMSWNVVL